MKVPLLDLTAQYATIRDDVRRIMDQVCDSQQFILGPHVDALEKAVADYSQCKFGVGVSSGTDALLVALMALDIKAGDEVITTPYSFFATAGTIARLDAKPVFVDIDPRTYNINPSLIERAITPRTKAIMPVHLYGQCAAMDAILKFGLPVIEDAAQAIGAEYRGRRAGSMGAMGCLSFFPTKNLGGFGDAGMVVTNDAALADRLRVLRVHGMQPKYYHKFVGGNFRIDALQAAILNVKLRHLDGWTHKRRENAAFYDSRLTGPAAVHHHIYNQYVIRSQQRDKLQAHLKAAGIGTEIYYPVPLHLQECFAYLGCKQGDFPESEKAAREVLALPVYPELTGKMKDYIAETILEFYQ